MKINKDKIFKNIIKLNTFIAVTILAFIIIFIVKESLPIFKDVSVHKFLTGTDWNPLSKNIKLSILPFILASIYTAIISIIIATPVGIGMAIFISFYLKETLREIIKSIIQVLMGVPSVIFGFIGLMVVVKFFESNLHMSSGECVLVGGIVLSIMILPCIISTTEETISKIASKYNTSSMVLGVSKGYMIKKLVLPSSKNGILAGVILAFGRAIGETMAVMLVIGNSPIMPNLFGRAETIPALIALEMGSAEVGSAHYHALFASGLVLLVMLMIINLIFYFVKKKLD